MKLAAQGVPSLYLTTSGGHAKWVFRVLPGGHGIVSPGTGRIASAINGLLMDRDRRHVMSEIGRTMIDDKGAERIASELAAVSAS